MGNYVERVLDGLKKSCGHETEFIQSATEVLTSLTKLLDSEPKYEKSSPNRGSFFLWCYFGKKLYFCISIHD